MDQTSEALRAEIGFFRRMYLWCLNPEKAYLTVAKWRWRGDGYTIAKLSAVATILITVQARYVKGQIDGKLGDYFYILPFAIIGAIIGTILMLMIIGFILHLVLNLIGKCGRSQTDASELAFLSFGPQILRFLAWPLIFWGFNSTGVFLAVLGLRLGLYFASIASFYHGLRIIFGISPRNAIFICLVPGIPVAMGMAMLAYRLVMNW